MNTTEFFPYSNGLAVGIAVAVVAVIVGIGFYLIYKKWKEAEARAIAQAEALKALQESSQENEAAIKATISNLEKSDERFKHTMRSNLKVAHDVAFQNMATQLQQLINENEIALKADIFETEQKAQVTADSSNMKMIIGMLGQLAGKNLISSNL